jgi:hypothetical protein
MRITLPTLVGCVVAALLTASAPASGGLEAARADHHYARQPRIDVPGAEEEKTACLDDLTTAGTTTSGHTDPADWSGLHAPGTRNPSGVPGIQVDGYFPDTSTTNSHNGWKHDSQFVIRLPDDWNGKLVISGARGTRSQYSGDHIFSDWLVAWLRLRDDGKGQQRHVVLRRRRDARRAVAEWNHRVTQLTRATKQVVAQRYGRAPRRTYAFGISNGGYLVCAGSSRTGRASTTAASTGRARSTAARRPTC